MRMPRLSPLMQSSLGQSVGLLRRVVTGKSLSRQASLLTGAGWFYGSQVWPWVATLYLRPLCVFVSSTLIARKRIARCAKLGCSAEVGALQLLRVLAAAVWRGLYEDFGCW
jgi:hypothetical protein